MPNTFVRGRVLREADQWLPRIIRVLQSTMAAARLHQQLDLRQQIEAAGGNVDVFAAIHALDLPLLVRPFKGSSELI